MSNAPLIVLAGRLDDVSVTALFAVSEPVTVAGIVPRGDLLFTPVLGSDSDVVVTSFRRAFPVFRPKKRQNNTLLAIAASLCVFNVGF